MLNTYIDTNSEFALKKRRRKYLLDIQCTYRWPRNSTHQCLLFCLMRHNDTGSLALPTLLRFHNSRSSLYEGKRERWVTSIPTMRQPMTSYPSSCSIGCRPVTMETDRASSATIWCRTGLWQPKRHCWNMVTFTTGGGVSGSSQIIGQQIW